MGLIGGGGGATGLAQGAAPIPPATVSGGSETTENGWNIHTFNTPGSLSITNGAVQISNVVIVGGGGGGGTGNGGTGGGGAGGLIYIPSAAPKGDQMIPVGTYTVTIGDGGAKGGNDGDDTTFASPTYTLTAMASPILKSVFIPVPDITFIATFAAPTAEDR